MLGKIEPGSYAATPNACLGPGYGQGAGLGRITILEPRGDSSGRR